MRRGDDGRYGRGVYSREHRVMLFLHASRDRAATGPGRELEFPLQHRQRVASSWLASATKARCRAGAGCSRPSRSFIVSASAATSSRVAGNLDGRDSGARRRTAFGQRGHLPPQPLHWRQGRACQPVRAQARDGDEDGPAQGELARHLALSGLLCLERPGRDGDPARVPAQRPGGDPRAFLVHRPR